ncbi:MAG: carbohydrate-binding family 9-like protein, partial [Myxococcota bacterium]
VLCVLWGTFSCVDSRPSRNRYIRRPLRAEEQRVVERLLFSSLPKMRLRHRVRMTEPGQGALVDVLGADVQPWPLRRGKLGRVTVYYRALRASRVLWRPFFHLQGRRSSRRFVNLDSAISRGARLYHSQRWQSGKIFRYTFRFRFPSHFSSSYAYFYTGFWHRFSRLRLSRGADSDRKNRLIVARVPVVGASLVRPIYMARYTSVAPKIDGVLDEPSWKAAASTGRFKTYNNRPTKMRTEAKMLWDNRYLYVSFDMDDDDIYSSYTKRDQTLWRQEVVELYIDANRNRRDYIELQVSPAGVVFDSFFTRYRFPKPWGKLSYDSGIKVRVQVRGTLNRRQDRDRGWRVEMRLPFSKLGPVRHLPPREGDEWSINMYRLEKSRWSGAQDHAWSPVMIRDYHRLERFGTLRFSRKDVWVSKRMLKKPFPSTVRPTTTKAHSTKANSTKAHPATTRPSSEPTSSAASRAKTLKPVGPSLVMPRKVLPKIHMPQYRLRKVPSYLRRLDKKNQ